MADDAQTINDQAAERYDALANHYRAEADRYAATQAQILATARARRAAPAPAPVPVSREEQVLRDRFGLDEDELRAWRRGLADYDPAEADDPSESRALYVPTVESERLWADARRHVAQERVAA